MTDLDDDLGMDFIDEMNAPSKDTVHTADKIRNELTKKLQETNGECIYVVDDGNGDGLSDAESKMATQLVKEVAESMDCVVTTVGEVTKKKGKIVHMLIRGTQQDKYIDLRVAVCGNVDAGKSTLVGVLTKGNLDDGRGAARASIFTHKHEIDTGRTSSIGEQILGFAADGTCVNHSQPTSKKAMSWGTIMEKSYKVVSFIDLAGHSKYIKTTVSGLTGTMPDYALLLVGANMGVTKMTKEHLGLTLALKIPIVVVITKIDMAPENVKKETIDEVHKILKMKGVRKMPMHIRTDEDLLTAAKTLQNDRIVPIFEVSSVTGENLDQLRKFLNLVPPRIQWDLLRDNPTELVIDQAWSIAGAGTVVGGTVTGGTIREGQTLLLGPDSLGQFKPVTVKSLQCNRVAVKEASAGKSVGVALKKIRRSDVRRGMILVDPSANPVATREFEADVVILHHSTSIKKNYEPVVQCMTLRQAARLVSVGEREILRTGDRSRVKFRFCYRPEYLKPGMRIIFREGHCKGIGIVTSVHTGDTDTAKVTANAIATTTTQDTTV